MSNYYVNGYTTPSGVTDRDDVKAIQQQLNLQGAGLKVDGIWGPKTDAAYQRANGGSSLDPYMQKQLDTLGGYMQQLQQMIEVPQINYTPRSAGELKGEIAAYLRPGYDQAIIQRQKATDTQRAELDADAWARGMGRSTYVTDVEDRAEDAEAEDIARLESEYTAKLAQLLYDARAAEEARAMEAAQYNANMQAQAKQLSLGLAQELYGQYAAYQQTGSKRGSSSKKKTKNTLSLETVTTFLSVLTPEERQAVYDGKPGMSQVYRQEILDSVGELVFLALQSDYPGAEG